MISARFKPAEDITAYELAQIVSRTHGNDLSRIWFSENQWAGLPPELKRHFQVDRDVSDG